MTVGEICTRSVVTAAPADTVVDAAKSMRDHHVGNIVVADSEAHPIGMLTDRDIVVSAVAQSADKLPGLRVSDIMSRDVMTAKAGDSIDGALAKMRTRGVRRLPVVTADGRLEGLVAFDDILEVMKEELAEMVGLVAREQKHEREVRK